MFVAYGCLSSQRCWSSCSTDWRLPPADWIEMALAGNPTRLTGTGENLGIETRRSFAEVMPVATDTTDKPGLLVFMYDSFYFICQETLLVWKLLIDADPYEIACLAPVVCGKRLACSPAQRASIVLGGRT